MDRPDWVPPDIDADRPSAARIYDYLLGGAHNFAADREAAAALIAAIPDVTVGCQANRAFLRRAVRFLIAAGVRSRIRAHALRHRFRRPHRARWNPDGPSGLRAPGTSSGVGKKPPVAGAGGRHCSHCQRGFGPITKSGAPIRSESGTEPKWRLSIVS